jgi:hypothetical protein
MMPAHGYWNRLTVAILIGAGFTSCAGATIEWRMGAQSIDSDILLHSETIYKMLVRNSGPVQVSESRFDGCFVDGTIVAQTQVEIGPGAEGMDVVMSWDRSTGDILRLRRPIEDAERTGALLGKDRAARGGERWLRALGIAKRCAAWRLASEPIHDFKRAYTVTWLSGTLRIRLVEDDRTGALLQVDVMRRANGR